MSSIYCVNEEAGKEAPVPPVTVIGGKARNLALMQRHDLPVPGWIVLTTDCFERFMGGNLTELKTFLKKKVKTQKHVGRLSAKLQEIVLKQEFTEEMKQEISEVVAKMTSGNDSYFSIRSSAVDEDGRRHSFAGQLESFLYVKPGEGLFDCVKQCFSSAFAERVMVYRYVNDLPFKRVRPAVIIQQMIFGDVSGVMFTGNPLTNNPEHTLINATYGIGEGIVSGELDSDTWLLDENGDIIKRTIISKQEKITFNKEEEYGTVKLPVEENLAEKPALSDETLQALEMVSRDIEGLFGHIPQDIEFCLKGNRIYILQARPVTTLSHIDKSLPKTIVDNSNIIESFPGMTAPFTFSFASVVYDQVYRQFFKLMGTPDRKINTMTSTFRNMLAYINGRIFYNLNSWYKVLALMPGYRLNRRLMEGMMGVKSKADIEVEDSVGFLEKWFVEIPQMVRGVFCISLSFFRLEARVEVFKKTFDEATEKYMDEKFEGWRNEQLGELYTVLTEQILKRWKPPIENDFFTMIFYGVLGKMVKKLELAEGDSLQNDLLIGQGDVRSTEPTKEIISITNWIREREDLVKLFRSESEESLIATLLMSDDPAYKDIRGKLQSYISRYGFRCMMEQKLELDSLKEDPSFIFTTIKNYLKKEPLDLDAMATKEKEKRNRAEKIVFAKVPLLKRPLVKWVLRNAREAISRREDLRFMRTQIFGIVRSIFNAVGRNFAGDGLIEDMKDIYFLHVNEVFELMEGRSLNRSFIRELIEKRKQDFQQAATVETGERLFVYGDFYNKQFVEILTEEEVDGSADLGPNRFKGVPCSPGEVEGVAKIVLSPQEADLDGEIMVTKRTDPGWVPLFPSVSGLIIERGSVLSHSAVVAREMGIPTIVGLRKITDRIKEGDRIVMNGTNGIVEIVEEMQVSS